MKKIIDYHVEHFIRFIYTFYNNYFYYLLWKIARKIVIHMYGKKNYNIMYNRMGSPGYMLWLISVILIRSNPQITFI